MAQSRATASKLEHASRLAAALGYLVVREGDEVGLSLADTELHAHLPPSASWAHLNRILESLGHARPEGQTNLGSCLVGLRPNQAPGGAGCFQ